MRYLLSTAFILFFAFSCLAQKTHNYTPQEYLAKDSFGMSFDKRHIDLGSIKQGDKREFDYVFKNTGTEDIEIEIVSACECSTLDWPTKAIKPGETAKINVLFDSTEKEDSETVEIDINLKNIDPSNGYKRLEILSFSFELIQE